MEQQMCRFAQAGKTAQLGELLAKWSASCGKAAPFSGNAEIAAAFSGIAAPSGNAACGTHFARNLAIVEQSAHWVQVLNRALAFAVVNDFADTVELLLRAKASVGENNQDGNVSIARAAAAGSQCSLVALANAGARLCQMIFLGEDTTCALELAARCGHAGMARLLLRSKVSCNCSAGRAWVSPLVAAAQHPRNTGVLRVLLDARMEVDARNSRGQTPLCAACLDGDFAGVRLLVRAKAGVNEIGTSCYAPLHFAAMRNKGAVAERTLQLMLSEYAACVSLWGQSGRFRAEAANAGRFRDEFEDEDEEEDEEEDEDKDKDEGKRKGGGKGGGNGKRKGGGIQILKLLLASAADVHAKLWNQNTALHAACAFGKTQAVALLIEAKAGLNTRNLHECTPLHFAASKARKRTVRWLVNAKCDVRARDMRGHTPLAVAAAAGRVAALGVGLEKSVKNVADMVRNAAAVVRILQRALVKDEVSASECSENS